MAAREHLRRQYLAAMGIQSWEMRGPASAWERTQDAVAENVAPPSEIAPAAVPFVAPVNESPPKPDLHTAIVPGMDWEALEQAVRSCTQCRLHQERTQTVFGVGNRGAQWMFVGEAPGAEEDRQGEPFVGRAGQLLNAMLHAIGLKREEVYIANVLKCLSYSALVQLGDGSWQRIGDLVRSRYDGEVMAVDGSGKLVRRHVYGWHESPLGERRVYRLTYRSAKDAGQAGTSTQLTGDHPVLTPRGYVPAAELRNGDRIATGIGLSSLAFDVVCGSLLGGGQLVPNSMRLAFVQSDKQRDYALFKAGLLRELSPQVDVLSLAAVSGGESGECALRIQTAEHRSLRILGNDFYAGRKRLPGWIGERLNERMLALWFMDEGYLHTRVGRQPLAEIMADGFPGEDLGLLVDALSAHGLQARAAGGRLRFDALATRLLCERIAPFVPPTMRHKLPAEIERRIPFDRAHFDIGAAEVLYDEVEIEEVIDRPHEDTSFFCIDIEETHNFVTAAGVVHNCRPPGNRDPQPDEVEQCEPFLLRQIELIKPRLLVALGRHAAHSLLKTELALGKLRGQRLSYHDIPLIVTYHPAYLLRNPVDKRKAWDDLCLARTIVETST